MILSVNESYRIGGTGGTKRLSSFGSVEASVSSKDAATIVIDSDRDESGIEPQADPSVGQGEPDKKVFLFEKVNSSFDDEQECELEVESMPAESVHESVPVPAPEPELKTTPEPVCESEPKSVHESVQESEPKPEPEQPSKGIIGKIDEFNEHPLEAAKVVADMSKSFFISFMQGKQIKKFTKRGKLAIANDFEVAYFNGSAMIYKYSGTTRRVVIPSTVGGLPVQYLHPDFLNGSINPFKSHRLRALQVTKDDIDSMIGADYVDLLLHGITEVVLPNTLVSMSGFLFSGCRELKELFIPPSVQYCDNFVYYDSGIERIYFGGCELPKGFDASKFRGDVFVKVKEV